MQGVFVQAHCLWGIIINQFWTPVGVVRRYGDTIPSILYQVILNDMNKCSHNVKCTTTRFSLRQSRSEIFFFGLKISNNWSCFNLFTSSGGTSGFCRDGSAGTTLFLGHRRCDHNTSKNTSVWRRVFAGIHARFDELFGNYPIVGINMISEWCYLSKFSKIECIQSLFIWIVTRCIYLYFGHSKWCLLHDWSNWRWFLSPLCLSTDS